MKRRVSLTVLIGACFFLIFQATPFIPECSAKTITLDYEFWLPAKIPIFPAIDNFFKGLEKATGGQVKTVYHMGGSMGSVKGTYQRTLNGINDIGHFIPGFYPGVFPMVDLFHYPLRIPSSVKLTQVMHQLYDKGYFDKDFSNVKLMGLNNNGPAVLFLADKKVSTLKDLKGLKLRTSSEAWVQVARALGAAPVAAPTGEVYIMLQKKALDGSFQIWDALPSYKLSEVCEYVNEFLLMTIPFLITMNKDSWNSLPKSGKDYIDANWKELSLAISRHYDGNRAPMQKMYKKKGGKITTFSKADYDKMNQLFAPIWDKFIAAGEKKKLPVRKALTDLSKGLSALGVENAVLGYKP